MKAGSAVALMQHFLIGGLKQAVGHFIPRI